MNEDRWYISATFETREQARQAASQMRVLNPKNYSFVATSNGERVWEEKAEGYGAMDTSV